MKHLSPGQIIDVAEDGAEPAIAAHARDCDVCRAEVASVVEALRLAGTDRPPEPSPLFWPHLAGRIGDAVRRERLPGPTWRAWAWRVAPIGAVAVMVVAAGVGLLVLPPGPARDAPVPAGAAAVLAQADAETPAETEPADDASWLLVRDLSAQVSVDEAEASGALPPPGAADLALQHLDDGELAELGRILREEIAARAPEVPHRPGA
jgi:hypothetical protein